MRLREMIKKRGYSEDKAEDLCHDTYLKACLAIARGDPGVPTTAEHFRGWLYTIAGNTATDQYRRHRRLEFRSLLDNSEVLIDPKVIELAMGRGFWNYYADNDADSVELLEQAVDEMHERSKRMQGMSRKFVPSRETPLNLLVVDEMGYLSAYMSDDKLRKRADKALRALLAKGRAPGFAVLGCLQDPRKEVCGYRDQFSIRIAGCMPAPMVDLVLGDGMYEAGAWCDQIPMPRPDGPGGSGVAYVIDETTRKPRLIRAPWSSDQTIRAVLARYALAVPKDELAD